MNAGNTSYTLADVWKDQRTWSLTANRLKQNITRWRLVVLLLTIAGALLSTLDTQLHSWKNWVGILGAIALVLIPIISKAKLGGDQTKAWLRSRSVSEGLKTEVYLYLTGAQPYEDRQTREQTLNDQSSKISSLAKDIQPHTLAVANRLSNENLTVPPMMDSIEIYITSRVEQQIKQYYRPKAAGLSKQAERLRACEFWSSVIAAVLGVVAKSYGDGEKISVWISVITTISVAFTAHLAAGKFEELVISYLSTAERLESLCNLWRDKVMNDKNEFVKKCEDAISVENQGWMAKFSAADG